MVPCRSRSTFLEEAFFKNSVSSRFQLVYCRHVKDFIPQVHRNLFKCIETMIDYSCFECAELRENLMQIKDGEITKILDGFEKDNTLGPNGLFLGGQKYTVLQRDLGTAVCGKKVRDPFVMLYRVGFENGSRR